MLLPSCLQSTQGAAPVNCAWGEGMNNVSTLCVYWQGLCWAVPLDSAAVISIAVKLESVMGTPLLSTTSKAMACSTARPFGRGVVMPWCCPTLRHMGRSKMLLTAA